MLEKTLEQLLLQYLDPYVDGISKEHLKLGVFGGSLELKNLTVKTEALAMLGVKGYRVRSGGVGLISLKIPLHDLYKGKVRVEINKIQLEVEGQMEAEEQEDRDAVIAEIRDAKKQAIELQTKQLAALMEQQATQAQGQDIGMVAKIIRKITNNISITIRDVKVSFVSSRGLAIAAELPEAAVLSTDSTFREVGEREAVNLTGSSMYKVLRLKDLGVRTSLTGRSGLEEMNYVLTKTCISLQLAHELDDPTDQVLRVSLDIAKEESTQIRLMRSQVKFLLGILNESTEYNNMLTKEMVPPEAEGRLFSDTSATIARYEELYEKELLAELQMSNAENKLTAEENSEKDLIEAALSVRVLAKERLKVRTKLEAINKEMNRREAEAAKKRQEEERAKKGFFGRLFTGSSTPSAGNDGATSAWMSAEEQEQLLRDVQDNSKVEEIDVPQRVELGIQIGSWALDLVDDRWGSDNKDRQVLSAKLTDAGIGFKLWQKQDYLQQDNATWALNVDLNNFEVQCKEEVVIKFVSTADASDEPVRTTSRKSVMDTRIDYDASPLTASTRTEPKFSGGGSHWLVAYELREDCNVMLLRFEFEPLRLRLIPGVMEQIFDFIAADTLEKRGSDASMESDAERARKLSQVNVVQLKVTELNREERVEALKSAYKRHSTFVKDTAQQISKRIPDKMEIDVRIASPIIVVPVEHMGTAKFTLGKLVVQTPEPAAVESLDLRINLDHTALSAESLSGEYFSMIEPTPIQVDVKYTMDADKGGQDITVVVQAEELNCSLAPLALGIFLAVPTAITSIFAPNYNKEAAAAVATKERPRYDTAHSSAQRETRFVTAVMDYETMAQLRSSEGVDIFDAEFLDDVKGKYAEVTSTPLICNVQVVGKGFSITLLDAMNPVLRLYLHMAPPGFNLVYTSVPDALKFGVEDVNLEIDFLNTRHGSWEPLVENFTLSVNWAGENNTEKNTYETAFVLAGKQPLLLNLTPTAVVRTADMIPQFLASLSLDTVKEVDSAVGVSGAKYRVVNLSDQEIELEFVFPGSDKQEKMTTRVKPTGSVPKSLDEFVLRKFAFAVRPSVPGDWPAGLQPKSTELSLDHVGMVKIEASGLLAELLVPENTKYHLLIISAPVRIHNQTDLELAVRFHRDEDKSVLDDKIDGEMVCDAALFGMPPPDKVEQVWEQFRNDLSLDAFCEQTVPDEPHVLKVPPNSICSAPVGALALARGASTSRCTLCVKPSKHHHMFSAPVRLGDIADAKGLLCPHSNGQGASEKDMNLVGEAHWHDETGLRSSELRPGMTESQMRVTTIIIRPAFTVLNALPFGSLSFRYVPVKGEETLDRYRNLLVPACKRVNIYNFPGVVNQGVGVKLRLGEQESPWSEMAVFPLEVFKAKGSISRTVDIAGAGVTIEPCGRHEMRISCPHWFIGRVPTSCGLDLYKNGKPLPSGQSFSSEPSTPEITLLPSDCLEKKCQLVIREAQKAFQTDITIPDTYSILPWVNPLQNLILCMQTEDIAYCDVFGAYCQVTVLRPRVVLTNSGDVNVELELDAGRKVKLAPQQSIDWHWEVKRGEEDSVFNFLRFKPLDSPSEWSGKVMCGDASAGSTAFHFLSGAVWSVDVVPHSGGLAVTFRNGSDLVAINSVSREDVKVFIKPAGCCANINIELAPNIEVPFGWMKPFDINNGKVISNGRHVDVTIVTGKSQQTKTIQDVGVVGKVFVDIDRQQFIIEVRGQGSKTMLKVRENLDVAQEAHAAKGFFKLSVKLSQLGISLVEEIPRTEELLYKDFDLLRMEFIQYNDGTQSFALAISEGNVNCQLPGRADATTRDKTRKNRQALGMMSTEDQVVVATNMGETERPFLYFNVTLAPTSSPSDIVVTNMEIALDAVELSIDEGWLDHLVKFCGLCSPASLAGWRYDEIVAFAKKPITVDFVPPPLPWVLQVDKLKVSQVSMLIFCVLKLSSVSFLPKVWRGAIQVLSWSDKFTLEGATVTLEERKLEGHRGSAGDFFGALSTEYRGNFLMSIGSVLGKSSLLNVPNAPIKLGRSAFAYLGNTAGLLFGETGHMLNNLTFDPEYVQKQKQIRSHKKITGVNDGFTEAGKSLLQGVEGLADIVKKPVQGAKKGGIGGLFTGLAKGVTGAVVKPIASLGQAVQDVSAGVGSQLNPDNATMKKRRERERTRWPRIFFTQRRVLRPWSDFEAQVQRQLGSELLSGVYEVIWMEATNSVLLLYQTHLIIAELPSQGQSSSKLQRSPTGIQESANRVFSQVAKPAQLLAEGLQDTASLVSGSSNSSSASSIPSRTIQFTAIEDVQFNEVTRNLFLSVRASQNVQSQGPVQLFMNKLGNEVAQQIAEGLRNAANNGVGDWYKLRKAIKKEQRLEDSRKDSVDALGAGQKILEVFEVERFHNLTQKWSTPFNPLFDGQYGWRWVDKEGNRHAQLETNAKGLSEADYKTRLQKATIPPCALDPMFILKVDWKYDKDENTDADGWRYALNFNASTWDKKRGLMDGVRKRRWTRIYE